MRLLHKELPPLSLVITNATSVPCFRQSPQTTHENMMMGGEINNGCAVSDAEWNWEPFEKLEHAQSCSAQHSTNVMVEVFIFTFLTLTTSWLTEERAESLLVHLMEQLWESSLRYFLLQLLTSGTHWDLHMALKPSIASLACSGAPECAFLLITTLLFAFHNRVKANFCDRLSSLPSANFLRICFQWAPDSRANWKLISRSFWSVAIFSKRVRVLRADDYFPQ